MAIGGKREKMICTACGEGGGKFLMHGAKWYHASRCIAPEKSRGGNVFPFTTNHIDGSPRTVENMRQLRALEKQHGVASVAFSNESSNW